MANEKRMIGYDPILFGEFVQSLKNTLEVYDPYSDGYEDGIDRITDWLEFNFVDAVEVVRCKDCLFSRYFEESGTRKCRTMQGLYRTVDDGDFCSYGERREGE